MQETFYKTFGACYPTTVANLRLFEFNSFKSSYIHYQFAVGGYSSDVSGGYSNRAYLMRCDVGALGSSGCGSLVWIRIANLNYAREGE